MSNRSNKKVAIIGAGLAGLSAAYELRDKASVTIFECEKRIGGRVLTSKQPPGEHGAEFFLKSEGGIRSFLKELNVPTEGLDKDPAYLIGKKSANGYPQESVKKLLPAQAARLQHVFKIAYTNNSPLCNEQFSQWLARETKGDGKAIKFVKLLLDGETCAPMSHITAQYGLECLQSVVDKKEKWYRIKGGADTLVNALAQKLRGRILLVQNTQVSKVEPINDRVKVHWRAKGRAASKLFDTVIIATPNGQQLVGMPPHTLFHAYISVLLRCRNVSWTTERDVDLRNGLYTLNPLGYIQEVPNNSASFRVIRVLIPNADLKLKWGKKQIETFCLFNLRKIGLIIDKPRCFFKKWLFGMPCGGQHKKYEQITPRLYLAGDRFGKWPSMNAAVVSGRKAARALAKALH